MSIATYGPLGYDYQYAATTMWLLENLANAVRLWVEPRAGEDAEATVSAQPPSTLELQAKSGQQPIDIPRLAGWLTHFPPYVSENCLLERLLRDEQRGIVFLVEGRSTDATSRLTRPSQQRTRQSAPEAAKWTADLLTAVRDVYASGESALSTRRQSRCNEIAAAVVPEVLGSALDRVRIVDQLDLASIQERSVRNLGRVHSIPTVTAERVLGELIDLVREVRTTKKDLVPLFQAALQEHRPSPHTVDPLYVVPPGLDQWFEWLQTRRVLLLTGLSQAGKTQAGRTLLLRLRASGFLTQESSDVAEADRFLSVADGEERGCLLDDPFGHVPSELSLATLPRLIRLARGVRPEARLVVTSRIEIVNGLPSGVEGIDGNPWIDISCRSNDLAERVWSAHSRAASVSGAVVGRFEVGLRTLPPEDLPQPGEIRHLALQAISETAPFAVLLRAAHVRTEELAAELSSRGSVTVDVVTALSLVTTTQAGASQDDIAFVLREGAELVGRMSEDSPGFSTAAPAPTYPEYPASLKLEQSERTELEFLRRHGYIVGDETSIVFAHPSYLLAGEELFAQRLVAEPGRSLVHITHALLCLSHRAATTAASKLSRFYMDVASSAREGVVDASLAGLRSLFPEVRDRCVAFLLSIRDGLQDEQEEVIRRYLDRDPYANRTIYWQGDAAWNNPGTSDDVFESVMMDLFLEPVSVSELAARTGTVSEREAWMAIRGARRGRESVPAGLVRKLIVTGAAFVRAEIARAFLQQSTCLEEIDLCESLLQDGNPNVSYAAIRGVADAWSTLDGQRRGRMWDMVATVLGRAEVAERCARIVFKFRGENVLLEDGDIWARIASVVLPMASVRRTRYRSDHLWERARQEIPRVSSDRALSVLSAWISRLERIVDSRWADDYECGVGDIIMLSAIAPKERQELFSRLLSIPDTMVALTAFLALIDEWATLSPDERVLTLTALGGRRTDRRWFDAAVSTWATSPLEVVAAVLPDPGCLNDPERCLQELPPGLLEDCVAIVVGDPPELRDVVGRRRLGEVWSRVLDLIRQRPAHPQFPKVVRYFVERTHEDDEDVEWWRALCMGASVEVVERLGAELLRSACAVTGGRFQKYWSAILARSETKKDLLVGLGKHLETIELRGNLFDDLEDFLGELSGEVPEDLGVQNLLRKGRRMAASGDLAGVRNVVWGIEQQVSSAKELRLHQTYEEMAGFVEKYAPGEKQLAASIDTARLACLRRIRDREEKFDHAHEDPPGWIVGCKRGGRRKWDTGRSLR